MMIIACDFCGERCDDPITAIKFTNVDGHLKEMEINFTGLMHDGGDCCKQCGGKIGEYLTMMYKRSVAQRID